MARRRNKKTLQRKGTKRKMQQWQRNHSSKLCRKCIWMHHKRKSKKEVYITEAQERGIPGNATVDHLMALKEAANQIKKRGKTAYMLFLDLQKVYDKAWLDAILYTLYRNGVGKKSRNNQTTEHGTHSTNPNQVWAHKENNDKRQYTTRRSAISNRICNPNGLNNQRDQQKWHWTRTKKWWKT